MTAHNGIRVRLSGGPRVITAVSEMFAIPQPPAWMNAANCQSVDPELFHEEGSGSANSKQARKVCGNCDVVSECLEYALERQERHGTWGGLSPRGRQKLQTERRRADGTLGQRICAVCSIVFAGGPNHRHCSPDCSREARRQRAKRPA